MDPLAKPSALVSTTDFRLKQAMGIKDATWAQIHATPDNSNE